MKLPQAAAILSSDRHFPSTPSSSTTHSQPLQETWFSVKRSLHLKNVIFVQAANFDDSSRRIFRRIIAPELNLYLVRHWTIAKHVRRVDHQSNARVQIGTHHLNEGSHVLISLTDARKSSGCKCAIFLIDATHAWGAHSATYSLLLETSDSMGPWC
ncbi:hypothetical protein BST61_g10450 [Cercospora zeina]